MAVEERHVSKVVEPLVRLWPILLSAIALIWQGSALTADLQRDRRDFTQRLEAQSAQSRDFSARITVLLEQVVPDFKERMARVEERVRALENKR